MSEEDPQSSAFEIRVSDPEKKGDGINAYMAYTITTKASAPGFAPSSSVSRRFTNFVWLYNQLTSKHPGVIVPPIPDKQALGRFEAHFIELRRMSLEKCLKRVAAHPQLSQSEEFKIFMEAKDLEGEIKKREPKKSLFSAFTSSMTEAVHTASLTFSKLPEGDDWFEGRRSELEKFDQSLKAAIKVAESFVKQRRDLALSMKEMGDAAQSLADSESNVSLKGGLKELSKVTCKLQETFDKQAELDEKFVWGIVEEYLRIIGSVKIASEARLKAYNAWKAAESNLAKKKGAKTVKPAEVAEAEKEAEATKTKYEEVSKVLQQEIERLNQETIADFQSNLILFVEAMAETQKKVLALWEEYLPVVQQLS